MNYSTLAKILSMAKSEYNYTSRFLPVDVSLETVFRRYDSCAVS